MATSMTSVVEFNLGQDEWARPVRFASDHVELLPCAAAQIAADLLPAMRRGSDLLVPGSIDPRLRAALGSIQDIHGAWMSALQRIKVQCMTEMTSAPSGTRVGCFFTGGVDSFYTLLKHRDVITDLIFVHGYDVPLDKPALRSRVSAAVREVATALGKGLVEIETDLRTHLDSHVEWGVTHGAALAAVAHLLTGQFRQVYIASSYGYAELFPWGSHPLLDPLWSSESLDLVHDGCEATRLDKVRYLAGHDLALRHLRVCYENPNEAYNCGRCRKCLLTMTNLHIAGALSRCASFPHPLDPAQVAAVAMPGEVARILWRQNLRALARTDPNSPLHAAIRKALRRSVRRERWKLFHKTLRRRLRGALHTARHQGQRRA